MRAVRRRLVPALCAIALLLSGCVSLPTQGRVVDSDVIDA